MSKFKFEIALDIILQFMEREPQSPETRYIPFVPREKEKEYCEEHNIEMKELDNGIRIVAISRGVEDQLNADIRANFATGAFNDPPGKSGLHHLGEHLICDPALEDKGAKIDAKINGETGPANYTFTLQGIANPNVRDFGVWPLLSGFKESLVNPLAHFDNVDTAIVKERSVVLRELAERKADYHLEGYQFRKKTILAGDNPLAIDAGGTPQGLARIGRADIEELIEKALIPDNAIVSACCEGPLDLNKKIAAELAELFGEFPRKDKKSNPVDIEFFDRLNPEFDPQGIYTRKGVSRRSVKTVELVWLLESEICSIEAYALERLAPPFSKKLNDYVRERGLSYGGFFNIETLGKNKVYSASFQLQSKANLPEFIEEDLIPEIEGLFADVTDSELVEVMDVERHRQLAIPMSTRERLDLFMTGLLNYGRAIDADEVKRRYLEITLDHLKDWRDQIVEIKPAIFIL